MTENRALLFKLSEYTERFPIMEMFYSLQGEGAHSGSPAFFIRLGGCDVGCVWCDVKESWPIDTHPVKTIKEIVDEVLDSGSPMVVITGGEPSLYDLSKLTQALLEKGIVINMETSGAHPIRGHFDWVCLSPKKFKLPIDASYKKADELKVIVYNQHDLKWAEEQASFVGKNCELFLQPEWSKKDNITDIVIEYIKENPKWRLSLQTHKYVDIR